MHTRKKLGFVFVLLPLLCCLVSMIAYGVISRLIAGQLDQPAPHDLTNLMMTRTLLSVLGLLGTLGVFTLLPIGLFLLAKKTTEEETQEIARFKNDPRYANLSTEQIAYIQKWSWSALLGQFVWSLGNKLYLWSLATFVPFFNIYAAIKLCFSGRRMSWERGGWKDFAAFKKRQTLIAWIIVILIVLGCAIDIVFVNPSRPKVLPAQYERELGS